ncbi:uncharacterized protein LOC141692133 [Apium graveolens]|uniref:uncharacterized protein LOC141692133 n=1 Tax=Apium graveolens TaxID=4045 RepID=UPI003D7AAA50
MKTIWEELDSMNMLPHVANPQTDVIKLLENINTQKEESRLFQFLNGLNEVFNTQRSNLLMCNPLPTVETACATLEQEEAQRALLSTHQPSADLLAMYSKVQSQSDRSLQCVVCGGKCHTKDKCWQVIGFPLCHPRNPKFTPSRAKPFSNTRWTPSNKSYPTPKMTSNAHFTIDYVSSSPTPGLLFTPQQLDQLIRLMLQLQTGAMRDTKADEEIDHHFFGMITNTATIGISTEWIINSGASDHMTPHLSNLINPKCLSEIKDKNGLYYLDTTKSASLPAYANSAVMNITTGTSSNSSPVSHQLALWHHRVGHASLDTPGTTDPNTQITASLSPTPPVFRKSTRPTRPPAWMQDFVLPNQINSIPNLATTMVEPQFHCFMASITSTHDPTNFKVAIQYMLTGELQ